MLLNDWLSSGTPATWVPLADALLKATVLLGLGALASLFLRRAAASTRHLAWTLSLVGALVLPALSLAVPRWQVPLVTLAIAPVPAPSALAAAAPDDVPAVERNEPALSRNEPDAAPATSQGSAAAGSPWSMPDVTWPVALLLVWAVGALAILSRLALGILAVQWMTRRTERVNDAPWLPLARELADGLGITPRLLFLRSGSTTMPMTWGMVRPAVLMPAEADEWPAERLRIVLLHELAHVKRRDCLTHFIAQVACALYWFNPLAWMAARHVRAEREHACDDLVLAAGTPGPDYADQLLEIARVMRAGRFPGVLAGASLAMAHRSQLEGRLMAILDPSIPRGGISRVRSVAASTLFALALMPLASMQPWAYAAAPDATGGDAMLTPAMEQARPAPRPVPQPEPVVNPVHPPVADMAHIVREVIPGAIEGAVDGATAGLTGGLVQSIVQGVAHGVTQGVAASVETDRHVQADEKEGRRADPKVVAALTAALKDSDKEVREAAMHALVQMRDPSIFEPMLAALKDGSPEVREQAAFALGQLRDKRAVPALAAAVKDANASVREQAVFALGQLRDPSAMDGLVAALHDENAEVRQQAAFSLGQLRDPRAVDALIAALKDADADVREQAAFALGQLRARGAVEALVVAMKDASASVREQSAFALGQIRDPRAIDALTAALADASADVRQNAAFALGQIAR